jgi:hypothetical protein
LSVKRPPLPFKNHNELVDTLHIPVPRHSRSRLCRGRSRLKASLSLRQERFCRKRYLHFRKSLESELRERFKRFLMAAFCNGDASAQATALENRLHEIRRQGPNQEIARQYVL